VVFIKIYKKVPTSVSTSEAPDDGDVQYCLDIPSLVDKFTLAMIIGAVSKGSKMSERDEQLVKKYGLYDDYKKLENTKDEEKKEDIEIEILNKIAGTQIRRAAMNLAFHLSANSAALVLTALLQASARVAPLSDSIFVLYLLFI